MATCLLDSTVIIDAINDRHGRNELLEKLIAEGTLLACCSINITEVHMGMRPHKAERTEELLASLEFYRGDSRGREIRRRTLQGMASERSHAGSSRPHRRRHCNP